MKLPSLSRMHRFVAGNGLEILLAPVPDSPVVSTWVWYRVGSRNEHPGITGAAHWLEHMLFKGSAHFKTGEIDRAIVGTGGYLNAFTDSDFTAYLSIVPREHAELPIAIESDRMVGATLPQGELDSERSVVLSEREMNENNPGFRVDEELHALAFHVHPYHWNTLGYAEDIRTMDHGKLVGFYDRFYGPANATLVVAGGFDPPSMRRLIEKRFRGVRREVDAPDVRAKEPVQRSKREATLRGPGSTPIVKIGWHAPEVTHDLAAATMMLEMYLGGDAPIFTPGHAWERSREHPSSALYRALVDRRLAVNASCEWSATVQPGLFNIYARAAPGVEVSALESAMHEAVERVRRRGVPAADLKELKGRLLINASTLWSGTSMIAFRLGYLRSLGGLTIERRLLERSLALRSADIEAAAEEIFSGGMTLVRYLPEAP